MEELRGRFEATELRLAELESRVAQLEYQLVVRGPEDVHPRRSPQRGRRRQTFSSVMKESRKRVLARHTVDAAAGATGECTRATRVCETQRATGHTSGARRGGAAARARGRRHALA